MSKNEETGTLNTLSRYFCIQNVVDDDPRSGSTDVAGARVAPPLQAVQLDDLPRRQI